VVVRVERSVEVAAPPREVWEFLADPKNRAEAVSVVERAEVHGPETVTWFVEIPVPYLDRTMEIRTEDRVRDPPNRAEWVGRATGIYVEGEHVVTGDDDTTTVENWFAVESSIPGVEGYFERNLEAEMENLRAALLSAVEE